MAVLGTAPAPTPTPRPPGLHSGYGKEQPEEWKSVTGGGCTFPSSLGDECGRDPFRHPWEQFPWSLYLNSQACAQRPGTQWNYEEKEVHMAGGRQRECTQHSRESQRLHSPSLPVTILTLPWLPVRIKSEPHTERQLLLHAGHTSEIHQAPNESQAGPETTSASLRPQ